MLATSRSGERLRRRSAMLRSGGPSKSSTSQSSPVQSRSPRWSCRDAGSRGRGSSMLREHAQALAHLLPAARDRREHLARRAGARRPPRSPRRASPRRARATRRSAPRRRSPDRASDASTTCIEPVTSPRRSSRSRNRAGSPASEESANVQPSHSAGTKRVTMPSVESIRRPECSYEPSTVGAFAKPCSLQEAQQLELGVVAGREQPVDLEHELLADHDRAVRVALADRAQRARGRHRQRRPARARGRSRSAALSVRHARRVPYEIDERARQLGVGERVVGRPAVDRRDRRRRRRARPRDAARSAAGRSRSGRARSRPRRARSRAAARRCGRTWPRARGRRRPRGRGRGTTAGVLRTRSARPRAGG